MYEEYDFGEAPDNEFPEIGEIIDQEGEVEIGDFTQHLLLSYLVSAPELWSRAKPILKTSYFDQEFRGVVKFIDETMNTRHMMPNIHIIRAKTGVLLNEMKDANDEKTQQLICDELEGWCRTQAYHSHLLKASEEAMKGTVDRAMLVALLEEAKDITNISMTRDLGSEVHTSTSSILTKAKDNDNIPTGFSNLDIAFSGGVTRPSFNIVSAAQGDGKSIFLQNIAINYAEMGQNVVFYTLELEPAIIQKRFTAMMVNMDINILYGEIPKADQIMRRRGKREGKIQIKKMPMVGTTLADISAHYFELCNNSDEEWGVVCIDYMDVMYPMQKVDLGNIHIKDKYVSEELNDFFHEQKLIGWSASQQTKGSQDEKEARQSSVSGGTPKISTCDNLIIGKRSVEDKEDERWWAHIEKARSSIGVKSRIPLRWDARTQRMSDGFRKEFEEANPLLFKYTKGRHDDIEDTESVPQESSNTLSNLSNRVKPIGARATEAEKMKDLMKKKIND